MFVQFGSRGRIVAEGVEADRCGGVEADRASVIVASVDVSVDVSASLLFDASHCSMRCMHTLHACVLHPRTMQAPQLDAFNLSIYRIHLIMVH